MILTKYTRDLTFSKNVSQTICSDFSFCNADFSEIRTGTDAPNHYTTALEHTYSANSYHLRQQATNAIQQSLTKLTV